MAAHSHDPLLASNRLKVAQLPARMPTTLDDYEVLYTIGSGSYGTCKKIKRKQDGKILVWKEMDYGQMSETEKQLLVSEVNLLRELKHQNIVRYYDRIIDRTNTMLYLVMEYCEGGDLGSLISRMKREGRTVEEDFVWKICIQVLSALKLCHSRSLNGKTVLHRDLKPANVFLDSASNVKLGDFGLARVLNHDTSFAKTFVGTPYYMSPEQMNYMSYNEKSDIWSLGCLLYELCTLRPPFTASNQTELAAKICVGQFTRIPVRYSDELQTVIEVMLQVDGKKRPSVSELCDHPCLSKRMVSSQHQSISSVKSSGSADEGYESLKKKKKALKAKEEALAAREKDLEQKERELQEKERTLAIREKLAEERLSKAEKLIKEYSQLKTKYQELTEANQDLNSSLSSCLSKGKKDPDTPKKQVTFHAKEKELLGAITDNLHKMNTGKDKHDGRLRNNATTNNGVTTNSKDFDLNDRYKRAKERSEELKRLEWESKLRTRALLAIR